jgi:hypothetical protein
MADPILDEDYIVTLLKAPVNHETTNMIQAGAVQALLDLYDRKVTRDVFCDEGSVCLALYGQASKLWVLNNIQEVYSRGELTEERFKIAKDQLCDLIRKQAEMVIETVKRLQLCSTSEDKVH